MNNPPISPIPDERDEYPKITQADLDRAKFRIGLKAAARQPSVTLQKTRLSVSYSPAVVAYFKATGPGWQARMDQALQEWIAQHPR